MKLYHLLSCATQNPKENVQKVRTGSFTVQITIRLCDLGEKYNSYAHVVYQKFRLSSPKQTTFTLQLANRSIPRTEGVVEDVLVQVGSLIFLVDFVVEDS